LENAGKAAINFHPGSPEYPGIGCTNFAIYDEAPEFGITCHHMAEAVDTGPIIEVRRFPLLPGDSVLDLTLRCYENILECFIDILENILLARSLPESKENWTRAPYTRRELNDLCRIDTEISEREMHRRIRATVFPNAPGPYIELHGVRFDYCKPTTS
jgi:methionyl-tRNA formyltransferase